MMPLQFSVDYFCSKEFLDFPIWEHNDNSESMKRKVCKRFEYIYAIVKKTSDINTVTHFFFMKFRDTLWRQYRHYCDVALLQFGYHKKYFDIDFYFMDEQFDIVRCIDHYYSFKRKRLRFMVVVFFLRYVCKELRMKFRKRKWDALKCEE